MERTMRNISLDFSECAYYSEIYGELKVKLGLPGYCGENLDALWDAVTGMMYTPARITVKNKRPQNAALAPIVEEILNVLREAQAEYGKILLVEE